VQSPNLVNLSQYDRLRSTQHMHCRHRDECVCASVCLPARVSHKSQFVGLYMLPVAVTLPSSDGNAICCLLPVLWTISCLQIMGHRCIVSAAILILFFFTTDFSDIHSVLVERRCRLLAKLQSSVFSRLLVLYHEKLS